VADGAGDAEHSHVAAAASIDALRASALANALDAAAEAAWQQAQEALTACPNGCGRTFLPDRVALHLKGCLTARGDCVGRDPAVRAKYHLPPEPGAAAKAKKGSSNSSKGSTTGNTSSVGSTVNSSSSNSRAAGELPGNHGSGAHALDGALLGLLEAWGAADRATVAALQALGVADVAGLDACLQHTSDAAFKRVGLNDFRRRKLASAVRAPSPAPAAEAAAAPAAVLGSRAASPRAFSGRRLRHSASDFDARGVRQSPTHAFCFDLAPSSSLSHSWPHSLHSLVCPRARSVSLSAHLSVLTTRLCLSILIRCL
jgi:hypothetical protein